jgi:hypothetical protein
LDGIQNARSLLICLPDSREAGKKFTKSGRSQYGLGFNMDLDQASGYWIDFGFHRNLDSTSEPELDFKGYLDQKIKKLIDIGFCLGFIEY